MKKILIYWLIILIFGFISYSAHAITFSFTPIDYPGIVYPSGTMAHGIDGNRIAGRYYSGGQDHGFVYNVSTHTYTTLDLAGGVTHPFDINGNNIVGYYGSGHGFLYNGSTYTTVDVPGAKYTYVNGIDGNNVVGTYSDFSDYYHGFLYNGVSYTLFDVPGALETFLEDIDGNNIVGSYNDTQGSQHGFLYNGSTFTPLYVGPGETGAFGIDGNNIVGTYYSSDNQTVYGFLYDGSTYSLLEHPGATSTYADGIDGNNIVGMYSDPQNGWHGFLATPSVPEPTTMLLIGSGLLGLWRFRRKSKK